MLLRAPLITATLLSSFAVHATPASDVPDPRPAHNVVDLTHTLTDADVAAIDAQARSAAMGELVVVVVPSTDGVASRSYARAYFDRVKIGVGDGRGVLLFVALTDHHAEIVLGHGFPSETERTTDAVMRDVVVAAMKRGDPRAAIRDAAAAIVTRALVATTTPVSEAATSDATTASTHTSAATDWFHVAYLVMQGLGVLFGLFFYRFQLKKLFFLVFKHQCPQCEKRAMRVTRFIKTPATSTTTGLATDRRVCAQCAFADEQSVELPLVRFIDRVSLPSSSSGFDNPSSSSSFDSSSSSSSSSSSDSGSSSSSGSSGSW